MTSAIEKVEPQEITPMSLIQSAILQGAGIDTIERLAKLQREMVEYEAKVQFNEALQRVQAKMQRISTDATNPETHSRYATYGKLDSVLRPIYSAEGFSLSFNTADSPLVDSVRVLCSVSRGGHSQHYQIDMAADGKGPKGGAVMTKTHATGAATQYGMRYLLKMIFNVAIGENDRDGNDEGKIEEGRVQECLNWIRDARDHDELKRVYLIAYKEATAKEATSVMKQYIDAKNKRVVELNEEI